MFDQNDRSAQNAWNTARAYVTFVGTKKREAFSYRYKLQVRRAGNRLIGCRTGTVTEQVSASQKTASLKGFRGEPFTLATQYSFLTERQVEAWCREHQARKV
jgi:hypothetical protein